MTQMVRLFALAIGLLNFAKLAHSTATCWVEAPNLPFGRAVAASERPIDSVVPLAVTCKGARGARIVYRVALSAGSSNDTLRRRMASAFGSHLDYNIYVDPARTIVWGDGQRAAAEISGQMTLHETLATKRHFVYGRVFGNPKTPVGAYSDSIIVTLEY